MLKSQQIAAAIQKNAQAIQAIILAQADGQQVVKTALTADEAAQVAKLEAELATLEADYKSAQTTEALAQKTTNLLSEMGEAANRLPMPGGDTKSIEERALARGAGRVHLDGSEAAGYSIVSKQRAFDALQVVYEEGQLGMDVKQLAAISSLDYKRTYRSYLRKGIQKLTHAELKTLQEGADGSGGFLVPEDVLNTIIEKMPTPTRLNGMVTNLNTSRDQLVVARVNYSTDDTYTTGIRSTWTGEIPSSSTVHRVTDPAFGQLRVPVHTNMMSLPITNDMVEDSAFPIVSWAAQKFNETIELLKDNMIINGDGAGKPAGILYSPGTTHQPDVVVSGHASQLTADGLIDLSDSLPEQYDENARFILNKTNAGKAIRKLKDSNNRYLFGMGLQDSGLAAGRPTELCGYPYAFSAFMPNVSANTFPIIFGDLRGYILLNRIGFTIQVLDQLYAESNQLVLLGRVRFGGQVAEPWKLKVQKVST